MTPLEGQPSVFSNLPFDLVCAVLRELAVDGIESGQLARTASLCLVSSSVCRFVRPILYHTFVIPQYTATVLEQIAATTQKPDLLGHVRRVCLLGGYGAWQPMPDPVYRAFNPRNLVAVSAQSITYAQFCASPLFRPREVYFRDDILDDVCRQDSPIRPSLASATHVLGIFPQFFPAEFHRADDRMRGILDALPAVTHLALFIHQYAWTPSFGFLPETGFKPDLMRRAIGTALQRERLEMLVIDVTSMSPSEQEETQSLISEFPGGRVRMLVDVRDKRQGFVNLWERDWLAGRGVWDGSESIMDHES